MERKPSIQVDVVRIVRQIRQQIEQRHEAQAKASQVRAEIREQMRILWDQSPFPDDVKKDIADRDLLWIFDPQQFWFSQRRRWGFLINMIHRLLRPLVKLFFNPDAVLHYMHRLGYLVAFQNQLLEDLLVERELYRRGTSKRRRRSSPRRSSSHDR